MDAVQEIIKKLRDGQAPGLVDDLRKVKISVIAGSHAGTEVWLAHGDIRLGSAPDNDIILFADDLQPHHCTIQVGGNIFGKIRIEAGDGAVMVNQSKIVEPGEFIQVPAGSTIRLANAQVRVGMSIEWNDYKLPAVKAVVVAALIAMLYVGSNLTGSVMTSAGGFGDRLVSSAEKVVTGISAPASNGSAGKSSHEKAANLNGVRAKLQELGLSASVRVASLADDSMRVFGSISPRHSAAWNRFQRWYDDQPGLPKLVRDVVRTASNPKLPKLQSVWLTGTPMAHFAGGGSASVGDELPGSWKVIEITAEAVTIERDNSPVRLKF
ncbi:MAG: FHA domain-containing protein [Pseudomonadota bacterium]